MADEQQGVDLSGLHRELDRLKVQLCRCQHQGTCIACKGFEVLREQSQMVVAAASQPVLMQVAQEAAIKDLMGQLGGVQDKLADDPHLQELMMRMMDRVQEDLGGPDELAKLFSGLGFPMPSPGSADLPGGAGTPPATPASESYDDRPRPAGGGSGPAAPSTENDAPKGGDDTPAAGDGKPPAGA